MAEPIRILLQTTIPPTPDDWHIGRFSRLAEFLGSLPGVAVTARDRATPFGETDPVLGGVDTSDFDQVWLFAVDEGEGLNGDECAALSRFRKRGGGLMVTRDHMDLGSSICTLAGVGEAHFFHTRNPDPDEAQRTRDDPYTTHIDWPNYHSGANGDFQEISLEGDPHPIFRRADGGAIRRLPAHPHEGAVGAPPDQPHARVVARGRSKVTGRAFNIAVAFEPGPEGGPAVAQSTFHHFADYNLDPRLGCPTFVDEPPGDGLRRDPEAMADTLRYFRNLAVWLAGRPV
ncbi:hypothetical protein [Phenylobacterium sp.]|uniref:hypothetical protein n=1 Tax=Phenylobacterium sp. TaxID=1871053 RepID=UPI0035B423C7